MALYVTVGSGLRSSQGRLLHVRRVEQVLGGSDPVQREAWYAFHRWKGNRRSSANWEASCAVCVDLDFRNAAGEKIPSEPFADALRKAFDERIIPGSHAYMSPHGFRVIFLLDQETSDRDRYKAAVAGCHYAVASIVRELAPEIIVDADEVAMKDLARLNWFPRTIDEKGIRRLAQLWTADDEASGEAVRYTLDALCAFTPSEPLVQAPPPPTAAPVKMTATLAAGRKALLERLAPVRRDEPAPETAEAVSALGDARLRYLASPKADLREILGLPYPDCRTCPLCQHKECFDPMKIGSEVVVGAYICRSTDHATKAISLGHPVGVPCRGGTEWKFDALDLRAWKLGVSTTQALVNLKFYLPVFERQASDEKGRPCVHLPNRREDEHYVSVNAFADRTFSSIPAGTFYRMNGVLGTLERDSDTLRHLPVSAAAMGLIAGKHVQFMALRIGRDGQPAGELKTNLGRADAESLVAYASRDARIRELRGVVAFPGIAGDYEPLAPGWNESGFYYDEPATMRGIQPAQMGASERRAFIEEYLVDFLPVLTGPDLANAVGLMVSAMIRPAMAGVPVPLHAAMSSIEGSGKSVLCDLFVGYGVTGRFSANLMLSTDQNENAKTLYAYAASGATCVNLDNIRGGSTVDDALLASTLTRSTITARVLGTSTMREQPNLFVPMMTGNNISFSPEMTRRVVPIRFTPKETIYGRKFRHDALEHVERNRRRLAEVLHGAVVEWKAGGRRGHPSGRELAGFRAWSQAVGGIVSLLGFDEWLSGVRDWQQSDESNPLGAALRSLLAAWYADKDLRFQACGVNQLWPLIADNPAALQIYATTERGQRVALGCRLRELEGRPDLKPYRVIRDGTRNHAVAYRVLCDGDPSLPLRREPGEEG